MSSIPTPPPLPPEAPPPPPSGQWAYPVDEKGEPKKKYVLWLAFAAAGCLGSLVLVGLAATVLVPWTLRRIGRAQQAATHARVLAQLQDLRGALELCAELHGGRYPDSLEALVRPDANGRTLLRDERELPRDPWGRAYLYDPPRAPGAPARLYSLGRDGRPGGSGLDEDVYDERAPGEGR
jgi:general secretion pathway protein G